MTSEGPRRGRKTVAVIHERARPLQGPLPEMKGDAQKIFLSRNGFQLPPTELHRVRNLKNTRALELWYMEKNGRVHRLRLPQKVHDGIIEYLRLRSEHSNDQLDCYAFACLASGLPLPEYTEREEPVTPISEIWRVVSPRTPKAGDVIVFEASKDTHDWFRHIAVYVGKGLYASVFGFGGELEVATLPELMKMWAATGMFRVVPRVRKG